jgi:hypothetical protein
MNKNIVDILKANVSHCDNPKNRIIRECEIIEKEHENEVWITSSIDGDFAEEKKMLFSYYPDELEFSEIEFLGKTEYEGVELFHKKDVEYLRS